MSGGIEVYDAVADALPSGDCSFDLALMVTTICFVDDARLAFEQAHRILKPSGFLIVGFIDRDSLIGKSYERKKRRSVFYRDAHFYSTDRVISYLREENFKEFHIPQTIFHDLFQIDQVEPLKKGYGEGSFVVINSVKGCIERYSETGKEGAWKILRGENSRYY